MIQRRMKDKRLLGVSRKRRIVRDLLLILENGRHQVVFVHISLIFSQTIYHLRSNLNLVAPDVLNVPAKQDVQEVDPAQGRPF